MGASIISFRIIPYFDSAARAAPSAGECVFDPLPAAAAFGSPASASPAFASPPRRFGGFVRLRWRLFAGHPQFPFFALRLVTGPEERGVGRTVVWLQSAHTHTHTHTYIYIYMRDEWSQ